MGKFLLIPMLLCSLLLISCEDISEAVGQVINKETPKAAVVNSKGELEFYAQPSGTYKAMVAGIECKATFEPTTDIGKLKLHDKLSGEQTYEYRIAEGGKTLQAGNIKTGIVCRFQYTYNAKFDTVKLDGILYTK